MHKGSSLTLFKQGHRPNGKAVVCGVMCAEECSVPAPWIFINVAAVIKRISWYICKCISHVPVPVQPQCLGLYAMKNVILSIFSFKPHGIHLFDIIDKGFGRILVNFKHSSVAVVGDNRINDYDDVCSPCAHTQNLDEDIVIFAVPAQNGILQSLDADVKGIYPIKFSIGQSSGNSALHG